MTSPRKIGLALAGLLCVWVGAFLPRAAAHDESLSASEVVVEADGADGGGVVRWTVDVGIAGLGKVVRLAAAEGVLTEPELLAARTEIAQYLSRGLEIVVDGKTVLAEVGGLEGRYEPAAGTGQPILGRAALTFIYRAPTRFTAFTARVRFFSELTAQHRALINVTWGDERGQFVRLGPAELMVEKGSLTPGLWRTGLEFFAWGCEHIFRGFDHVAFLIALLLAVTRFWELVRIVTAFTVAHSATLLLAAFNLIAFPSRLTEILIAASILYVAIENITWADKTARHRWLITFGFGLVHGLGFATELRTRLSELPGSVIAPVVAFNLGVEVGQLGIVCLVFPLLTLARRADSEAGMRRRQRQLLWGGSLPLAALALYWLVDRLS